MDDLTCLTTQGFDINAAVFLAEASAEAYSKEFATTPKWAKDRKFNPPHPFDTGNTQGFWAEGGDVALLSFRGTSNTGQWIRDLRLAPAFHKWGLVHRGFKTGVSVVEDQIAAFAKVAKGKKHVWITGHSLGGALAVLAAANLKIEGIQSHLYTYGQPRAGYWNFADQFDYQLSGRLYRFINQSDIVARVPSGLLFSHCGIPKRIVKPGTLESGGDALPFANPMPDAAYQPGPKSIQEGSGEGLPFAKPVLTDGDIPGITEREFLMLQLQLGVASEGYEEGAELEGGVDSKGLFADHAITEYIRLLSEIRDAKPQQ
jgi:hypothetical protein